MPAITISPTCPASDGLSFNATNGVVFNIHCGIDYYGNDLKNVRSGTFAGCINTCATMSSCVDVSYNNGICYLKSVAGVGTAQTNANVWTAVLATTEAANANKPQCPQSDGQSYITPSGDKYLISCGVDYQGGDLSNFKTTQFDQCINTCDTTSGCVDVTFHHGYCYMKQTLTPARSVSDSWAAKFVSKPLSTTPTVGCPSGLTTFVANNLKNYDVYTNSFYPLGPPDYATVLFNNWTYPQDPGYAKFPTICGCLDYCSRTSGCVAADYENSDGSCAMLSNIGKYPPSGGQFSTTSAGKQIYF